MRGGAAPTPPRALEGTSSRSSRSLRGHLESAVLALPCCVALGKSPELSGPVPHLGAGVGVGGGRGRLPGRAWWPAGLQRRRGLQGRGSPAPASGGLTVPGSCGAAARTGKAALLPGSLLPQGVHTRVWCYMRPLPGTAHPTGSPCPCQLGRGGVCQPRAPGGHQGRVSPGEVRGTRSPPSIGIPSSWQCGPLLGPPETLEGGQQG